MGDRTEERTAIVTGAASGIGMASARALIDEGWTVVAVDRDEVGLRHGADDHGRAWRGFAADVADEAAVDRLVAQVEAEVGPVRGLVNSAGISSRGEFLEVSLDDVRRLFEVNVIGTLAVSRAVARAMRGRGAGAIVNLTSIAGLRGSAGRASYGISKAAVALLTKTMAIELAPHGIRVNAVAPGPTETALVQRAHDEHDREAYTATVPLGRYARPEEIAQTILFALDDARSSYLTGHILAVDGGLAAER